MLLSAGVEFNEIVPGSETHVEDVQLVAHEWVKHGSRIARIELRIDEVSQSAVKCGHRWGRDFPVIRRDCIAAIKLRCCGIDHQERVMPEFDGGPRLTLRPQGGDCGRAGSSPRILLRDRVHESEGSWISSANEIFRKALNTSLPGWIFLPRA